MGSNAKRQLALLFFRAITLLIPQLVQRLIPVPSETDPTLSSHLVHAAAVIVSPTAPWVVFANGLLTNLTMRNHVIPYFIQAGYNVLVHSQRGHGKSTLPDPSPSKRQTTIPSQAYDIAHLIHVFQISPIILLLTYPKVALPPSHSPLVENGRRTSPGCPSLYKILSFLDLKERDPLSTPTQAQFVSNLAEL